MMTRQEKKQLRSKKRVYTRREAINTWAVIVLRGLDIFLRFIDVVQKIRF